MKTELELLENRHDIPAEELSDHVSVNFGGNLLTLRQLEPFIIEIKRRFKTLPRKMGVDGEFKTIKGYRSFKSWCDGVLHRTDRTVRYMLAKSKKEKQKPEKEAETLSAASRQCIAYITKKKLLDKSKKDAILEILNRPQTEK